MVGICDRDQTVGCERRFVVGGRETKGGLLGREGVHTSSVSGVEISRQAVAVGRMGEAVSILEQHRSI